MRERIAEGYTKSPIESIQNRFGVTFAANPANTDESGKTHPSFTGVGGERKNQWYYGDTEGLGFWVRADEGWSRHAPGPWYGPGPAWPSTWIGHEASLDSAYPQPDGGHTVTP